MKNSDIENNTSLNLVENGVAKSEGRSYDYEVKNVVPRYIIPSLRGIIFIILFIFLSY